MNLIIGHISTNTATLDVLTSVFLINSNFCSKGNFVALINNLTSTYHNTYLLIYIRFRRIGYEGELKVKCLKLDILD